ncbi:hypothetical protein [Streptomyces sp. NPDC005435]|uniref:hypothetical protein n=1 Tax=Streptomyces sp. NPDC005435 TaxID=3154464 RepID=UPI003456636A
MTLTPLRQRGTALAAGLVSTTPGLTACSGSPEETPAGKTGAASGTRGFKADNDALISEIEDEHAGRPSSTSLKETLATLPEAG